MSHEATASRASTHRAFYTWAGGLVLLVILLGFGKSYYLKGLFGTPALSPLLHLHGLIMSLWFLLFVAQAWLVSARRVDLHRKLGVLGGLVALAVLGVGTVTALEAARLGRSPGPPALVFLVVPLGDLVVFAALVGLGLAYRTRPDVHKRLMLLSCLGILGAAVARIPVAAIQQAGPLAFFGLPDLLILGCLALDWRRTGRLHPAFAWGALFVILSHPLRLMLGGTALWLRMATWMVG